MSDTVVRDGYEYDLFTYSLGDMERFDRWAEFRKSELKYDSRFTFVWLSRSSFEFNTSNGSIVVVTLRS